LGSAQVPLPPKILSAYVPTPQEVTDFGTFLPNQLDNHNILNSFIQTEPNKSLRHRKLEDFATRLGNQYQDSELLELLKVDKRGKGEEPYNQIQNRINTGLDFENYRAYGPEGRVVGGFGYNMTPDNLFTQIKQPARSPARSPATLI